MIQVLKEILRDHSQNVHQIFKLAKADLVKTYRGAALGWSWAVIKPCMTLFTYWFAFEIGLRSGRPVNGVPFFLWLACGIVPWFYMADMLTLGTDCIRRYTYLVTKMKFPVSVISTFFSLSKMMINVILVAVLVVIYWIMGFPPNIYYLQLPLYIVLSFLFFTLWAQFSALFSAISKDFLNLVKAFVTPLFWLSGILWDADSVSNATWVRYFLAANPITFLITGFRNSFVNHRWFFENPLRCLCFLCWLLLFWLLSLWAYKRLRKEIPDVL
ncbi:MAG: ABC transporter permease [Clostridia bacterium]|nr:ABC transporter permease [Clostridia bacterium]